MAQAGVVLLDLREDKAERGGTRYEIYQLMNAVSVERIVVLIGDRDDSDAILAQLCDAWDSMSESSPNRRLGHAELRVCRLRSGSAEQVEALFTRFYAPSLNAGNSFGPKGLSIGSSLPRRSVGARRRRLRH